MGVLKYSDSLLRKLQKGMFTYSNVLLDWPRYLANVIGTHLEKGSESECEIRGCSIHAIEVTILLQQLYHHQIYHIIVIADPKAAYTACI